jgi:photosystem II stability/assembly factor-like uncharacterized protein
MSEQHNIIDLDTVTAITSHADRLYVAKVSGLYCSDDMGQSWRRITDDAPTDDSPVTAVVAQDTTILAGLNGGVLRSVDAGTSWHVVALSAPPPLVSALIMSPNFEDDGTAFAGTAEDGVFITFDHGESWMSWNFGLIDLDIYCLALSPNFAHDMTLYAGTETGLFCSRNAGKSWHDLPFPMTDAPVLSMAITPAGYIVLGTEDNGLFVSDDNGQTWSSIPTIDSGTIHAIQAVDERVFVLTEQQVLIVQLPDLTVTTHTTFDEVSPIVLGQAGDRWLVGYTDGRSDVI